MYTCNRNITGNNVVVVSLNTYQGDFGIAEMEEKINMEVWKEGGFYTTTPVVFCVVVD